MAPTRRPGPTARTLPSASCVDGGGRGVMGGATKRGGTGASGKGGGGGGRGMFVFPLSFPHLARRRGLGQQHAAHRLGGGRHLLDEDAVWKGGGEKGAAVSVFGQRQSGGGPPGVPGGRGAPPPPSTPPDLPQSEERGGTHRSSRGRRRFAIVFRGRAKGEGRERKRREKVRLAWFFLTTPPPQSTPPAPPVDPSPVDGPPGAVSTHPALGGRCLPPTNPTKCELPRPDPTPRHPRSPPPCAPWPPPPPPSWSDCPPTKRNAA